MKIFNSKLFKVISISFILFLLLWSCRKNEIQDNPSSIDLNYNQIKNEFFKQFSFYNLTGKNFTIDWQKPSIYVIDKTQYFVFSIVEQGICSNCDNSKQDELPVYKLVVKNNLKSGNSSMFFYKVTPSVRFLRSNKRLSTLKWDIDKFRGFKEIYDLKGKLISKEYVNDSNLINVYNDDSGIKIFDVSEPCTEVQVFTYTRTCTYSGYELVGCTAWSLSDISSYYTGDCGTGGNPPPYTVPIDTIHANLDILNDTLQPCPGDPIKNPTICPTKNGGKKSGRNGLVREDEYGPRYHDGLDIESTIGSTLYSMYSGEVSSTGYSTTYGNWIIIKSTDSNGNDFYLKYNHLSMIGVSNGQAVFQGNKIGATGNTGNASTPGVIPHVHIQFRPVNDFSRYSQFNYNAQDINPETWLSTKFDAQGNPLPNSNCN